MKGSFLKKFSWQSTATRLFSSIGLFGLALNAGLSEMAPASRDKQPCEGYFSYDDFSPSEEAHKKAAALGTKTGDVVMTRYAIADAVEKAFPALVNIQTKVSGPFGSEGVAAGSGFIFNAERKLVATNFHVVQQSDGTNLLITRSDGNRYKGVVHSFDAMTDIAVIELTEELDYQKQNDDDNAGFFSKLRRRDSDRFHSKLTEVKFGNSSSLRVGEWVVALGSPLNMQNTVTSGIVSSVNRHANELGVSRLRTDYIQTDASINQGNSGGPLINLEGEVVGINSMKVANTGGISFAIPIDTAKIVLGQLQDKKRVDRPYIGIKMLPVRQIRGPGDEIGSSAGVLVTAVESGSPASRAGLQEGDFIIAVDDQPIKTTYDVIKILGYDVGRTHKMEVLKRDGKKQELRVTSIQSRL